MTPAEPESGAKTPEEWALWHTTESNNYFVQTIQMAMAQAWEEGTRAAMRHASRLSMTKPPPANPYRPKESA